MLRFEKIILFLMLSVWLCGAADIPKEVVRIGLQKQLFFDDANFNSIKGITFTMNPPEKTGQLVLEADAPWEKALQGKIGPYCSIIKEEGKTRLWYDVRFGHSVQVAYAESDDGIHFTKPVLGLHPLDGSTQNNIVIPTRVGGGAVWIDPLAPADKKYRCQMKGYNSPTSGKLYCYYSADGIDWKLWQYQDVGDVDTQSIVFWDQRIRRYVLYTRQWAESGPSRHRKVRRLDSDDLMTWENEVVVMQADIIDNATYTTPTPQPPLDFYGAAVFRYPDDNGLYLMLTEHFWHFKRRAPEKRWGFKGTKETAKKEKLAPSVMDVRLAASTDGLQFNYLGGRKPFLTPGIEGSFDSKRVWALPNPIIVDDEIWIYYAGGNTDHDGFTDTKATESMTGISLAKLRLDGFVSADADYSGGEITTGLIQFEGNRLSVNLDTGGGGSLQVEILNESGNPIKGYTQTDSELLIGNSVKMPVTWKERDGVGELAGKPVQLRFIMRDCKLYAYQFLEN